MFDVVEAINDIIDDINDDAMESAKAQYEQIYETLCLRVECGDLTLEDAEAVNEAAYEKYFGESPITEDISDYEMNEIISESIDDLIFGSDIVTEGSNMEYASIFKKGQKEFKGLVKQYKTQLKSGKFNEARKTVKSMEKTLDKMETGIRNIKSTTGSIALSAAISSMIVIGETCLIMNFGQRKMKKGVGIASVGEFNNNVNDGNMLMGDIDEDQYRANQKFNNQQIAYGARKAQTGYYIKTFGSAAVGIAGIVKRLKGILKECKVSKKTNSTDYFNTLRNRLLKEIGNMKKQVSKLSKAVDEAEKKAAKSK